MKRLVTYTAVGLLLAEVLLILVSWLLSATMTEGVRSLLSTEGIRWFFGQFTSMQASPWLVWLLLLSVAWGSVSGSGLIASLTRRGGTRPYRERLAIRLAAVLLLLYVGVVIMLTAVPHAVLLSATGSLFPSAFSRSLVPLVAFGVVLLSVAFGFMSGRFSSLSDVVSSLTSGISAVAPLFLIYLLAQQLVQSLAFVFF